MEKELAVSPLLGKVKTSILSTLEDGERSVSFLAESLGINKTAVKEHMDSLERMGYVRSFFKKERAGRPSKYYEISQSGMELFPKKYSELMATFLEEFTKEYGEMKLNLLLGHVADRMMEKAGFKDEYEDSNRREGKIERLKGFVDALNRLGYYARMEVNRETVRIIRHNCIFYEIAKNNGKIICDVLGKDMIQASGENKFSLVEKFSDGGNKCVVEVDLNQVD
ncbi:MAG: helix-turn-helix transcriptional regulator [Cuniculiplasma sp.]